MISARENSLLIQTPEGISFSFLLAGPVRRGLAVLIDIACVSALCLIVGQLIGSFRVVSSDVARALTVFAYFVVSIGYGILAEWYWRGQTVGKRLLRLRVMDLHGLRLQFSQIVVRNLLRCVDMLPAFYLVGGLACLLSRRAQRLGDFAANTVVVVQLDRAEPNLDQLLAGKFNSLRAYPHLAARLRQHASPLDARIALQALLRRDEFISAARIELFAELAEHFRGLAGFPAEATDGLSDEQYVRNVVDLLFRPEDLTRERHPLSAASRAELPNQSVASSAGTGKIVMPQ